MAVSHLLYIHHPPAVANSISSKFTPKTEPRFPFPFRPANTKSQLSNAPNSETSHRLSAHNEATRDKNGEIREVLGRWVGFVRSGFPGGSWWKLSADKEEEFPAASNITVMVALNRMWGLIGDDRWVVYAGLVSLAIAAVSEISMPNILAASVFAAQKHKTFLFTRNLEILVILCVISGICSGLRSACFQIANTILVKRLRGSLYSVLLLQDISFFDAETVGGLTSRLGTDCQQLSNILGNNILLIVRNALQGTGALINLVTLSWPLAFSALMICSVLAVIFLVYGRYQKEAASLTQEFTARSNEVAEETLSLMKIVRAYGTENKELIRYKKWLGKMASIKMRESVAFGLWNMTFSNLYRSTQVIAVLLGGMSVLTGHVSAEQLTKYVLYCEWLIYATWRLVDNLSSLLQSIGATQEVFQLMDLLPSDQFLSKGVILPRLKGHIHFSNVSFQYPSRLMAPVLQGVNLTVQADETVAIVGPSGSGKSTLVNLLVRLYEPTDGQIYIDGIPLKELDVNWLRGRIGYVQQEPHLLYMDVKSNISYGCLQNIKFEDIERAAKQAHAHEFISSLPNGYETYVDDQLLSGGQKQRIAIARALCRDPAILILDEATSALDSESEFYVKGILDSYKAAKRTVIVIAHRLSTVKAAERIAVMEGGRIVEVGSYEELLLKDGLFARLIKAQTNVHP